MASKIKASKVEKSAKPNYEVTSLDEIHRSYNRKKKAQPAQKTLTVADYVSLKESDYINDLLPNKETLK